MKICHYGHTNQWLTTPTLENGYKVDSRAPQSFALQLDKNHYSLAVLTVSRLVPHAGEQSQRSVWRMPDALHAPQYITRDRL